MLSLRLATLDDLPTLAILMDDHKAKILDDYTPFNVDGLRVLVELGTILAIVTDAGYPVGFAGYTEVFYDLHAEFHFIVRPEFLRQVLKQKLLNDVLRLGFDELGVSKIKAKALSTQKGAARIVKMLRFKDLGPRYKETRQNGVIVDIRYFELRKDYWRKAMEKQA